MAGPSPAKGIFGCVWIVGDNRFSQPDSRGLGPAIYVFKPADRKDRPNQGYLDGSGELSRHAASALCSSHVVLAKECLCGVRHRSVDISHSVL